MRVAQSSISKSNCPIIQPHNILGMKIIVVPETAEALLSWKRRLISWPWKPWIKTETVSNPSCPEAGKFYAWGNDTAYCSEKTFAALNSALGKENDK